MSDLAPSSRRHRIGRFLRTAGPWLADRLIRPSALIPLMVLLATWVGFQMNAGLYKRAVLASDWYDATLIVALLLPPLTGHLTAWVTGHHSGFWWGLWIPAVALYWLRPWQIDTGWAFFWREHLDLWPHFVNIFRLQEQAPLRSFMRLGGVLTMALVTFMVAARSWLRLTAWLRQIGRDTGEGSSTTGAGAGKAGGLPQATWASAAEVRDIFTHRGGIVLGEHTDPLQKTKNFDPDRPRSWKGQGKGRLITMNPKLGNGHVVVLAASAGYKTAGIVIPNILHYNDPLVVIDPKGDLYARTRDARKDMGFEARVIEARHGFDPFRMIAPLAPEAPSVYLTMARTLMPLGDRASDISEYFHEMSTTLFAALMGHFIAENSTNVAADISAFINRKREIVINEARYIATRHNFPFIKDEMEGLAALDERTFPGVVKGISNKLAFTRFPDIAAYGQSDESPEAHLAALGPKSDIFINFPTQAAEDFSSFPRLLIGAIYVASELIEQADRPRARRLFLIDEARVLGGMDALNTIRDAGRSLGLHLMLIYQNYGQLTKAWGGESGAAAWLDSCEARVISAVGSSRTANDIVTMLGRRTLRTRVQGSSASSPVMTPMGGSVSSSEQEQIREVPLMSAATLGQLPAHGTLIFTRRSKPILATKAIFFTRDKMAPLVKSPDAVKGELEATRRRDAVMKRIRDQQVQNLPDPQPGLRRTQKKSEEKGKEEDFGFDLEGDVEAPAEMRNKAVRPGIDPAAPEPEDAQPPVRSPVTYGAVEATDPAPMTDYKARTQKRIADALAQKARTQKAREAANSPVPAQENGAPGADEVADAGAELETPGVTREQAGTAESNGGSAEAPEQDAGVSEASSPDPILDPDGLTRDDRSALSMIMGMLAIRPALRGTVVRALQDDPEPEAGANLNARKATAADATEGTVRKHEPETEPDIEREKATGTAREGATENPEASEPHEDHASEEKDADTDLTPPASSEAEKGTQEEPPTAGGQITQSDPGHARKDAEPSPQADDNNRPPVQFENPVSKEQPDIGKNPEPNENAAVDVPSPNDDAPDLDQPDADLSDPEIDAAIDMLWVEQIEIPPTETGEAEPATAQTGGQPESDPEQSANGNGVKDNTDQAGQPESCDPQAVPDSEEDTIPSDASAADVPSHDSESAADPDQMEADLELDAAIDMLWVERIELLPTEAGEVETQAVATDVASEDALGGEAEPATARGESPTAGGSSTQSEAIHAKNDAKASLQVGDNIKPPVHSENPDPNENAALDVPSPNDDAADPDQPDADLSDPEIDAAIDMLWVEQIELPPTETGEVETQAVATDDASTADIPSHDDDDLDTASKAMEPTDSAGAEMPAGPAPSTASKKVRTPARKATPPRKKTAHKSDPVARRRRSLDADDVHAAFDPFIENFFREYLGEPVRPGASDWRAKTRPAFSVCMTGSRRGQYYDHKAKRGGTLFDLLAIYFCDLPNSKADFPRVLEAAADYAGFSPSSETPRTRAARKQRKKERDRKAAVEDQRRAEENTLLVLALRGLVTPVASSPAETYLCSRHITSWSGTGLGFLPALDTTLPEPLQSNVYAPEHPALVVWAMNAEGTPTGGQRILLDDAGKAVPVTPAKPSFGSVSGCPARFPAGDGIDAGEPLLVAEGPETALTLRLATGCETWAVFGVSNWQSAPLPLDRDIILAPDRDAALSPAGKTFRKAVAHHLQRGCRLRIAPAPEPEGSKKDLNDTLMDQGIEAVRAALEAAHPPGPEDLPDETADESHESESHGETAGASETRKNGKDMEKDTEKDDEQPKGQSESGGSE